MTAPHITFRLDTAARAEVVSALVAAGATSGTTESVRRTVLDTFDGLLDRAGMRLELTSAGPKAQQRVTVSLTGAADELGDPVAVVRPPTRAVDLGAVHAQVIGDVVGGRRLLTKVVVREQRTAITWSNKQGEVVLAASLHENLALSAPSGESAPVPLAGMFLEVRPVAGKHKRLRIVLELCTALELERVETDSLSLALAAGDISLRGNRSSPTVPLDAAMTTLDGFRAVLDNLRHAILAHWDGAAGDLDPAFLHGLRVALRRTRSVIAEGATVLPPAVLVTAVPGFGRLGALTGPARDLDVYLLGWDTATRALGEETADALQPVRGLLERRRTRAYRELKKGLRSSASTTLLDEWTGWLTGPAVVSVGGPDAPAALREYVVARIEMAHEAVLEHGRLIDDSSPAEQLHDLRKDAKKLRYLLECFGGLLPRKQLKRFVRRLKRLQDNLGAHQDADVMAAALIALSPALRKEQATPATTLAVAQLVELLEARRLAARAEFAARFAEYDSDETQDALALLLDLTPESVGGAPRS
jgi:CHAD domain-containing protein